MLIYIYQIFADWTSQQFLNNAVTLLNTLIGLTFYFLSRRTIKREMKTAPRYKFRDKFRNWWSSGLYATLVAVSVAFVSALVFSTIGSNLFEFKKAQELVGISVPPYVENIAKALVFPTYLPITLILIAAFAFVYPLYEYLMLADQAQDAPMEIQRFLENNIIERVNYPWTYLISILLYLVVSIVPPFLISFFTLKVIGLPHLHDPVINLTVPWIYGLFFFTWLLSGSIFYLSFYSSSGTAQSYYRHLKTNKKKNKKSTLILIFAILGIIASINSFYSNYKIFFTGVPVMSPGLSADKSGFIYTVISLIHNNNPWAGNAINQQLWGIFEFITNIFPLDYLLFFLTTCAFGLLGFKQKFLDKEPLNRPTMVLFATYIICGIAFSIFINAVIRWPWVIPDTTLQLLPGFNLSFHDPGQWDIIYRIFIPPIMIEKGLNIIFLTKFLFFSKEVKSSADEWVLNRAILQDDFATISKYTASDNPEIRKMAARSIVSFMKLKDKLTKSQSQAISKTLGEMLVDENKEVVAIVDEHLQELVSKLWLETITSSVEVLLRKNDVHKHRQAQLIIQEISKQDLARSIRLYNRLLNAKLSKSGSRILYLTLTKICEKQPQLLSGLVTTHIRDNLRNEQKVLNLLDIIKNAHVRDYAVAEKLVDECTRLLTHDKVVVKAKALEVFGIVALANPSQMEIFLDVVNGITPIDSRLIRQKVGGILKILEWKPEEFDNQYEYLVKLLSLGNPIIKHDVAIAFGSLTVVRSMDEFEEQIFPNLVMLINDDDPNVKLATLSSLLLIAKVRDDIFHNMQFQLLLGKLMVDGDVNIRHQVYNFLIEGDVSNLLPYFVSYFKEPQPYVIRMDMLNLLYQIAPKITPLWEQYQFTEMLTNINVDSDKVTSSLVISDLIADGTEMFGLPQLPETISLKDSITAVLYEVISNDPSRLGEFREMIEKHDPFAGELAQIKKLEFFVRILPNVLSNDPTFTGLFDVNSVVGYIRGLFPNPSPIKQKYILNFMNMFYRIKTDLHKESLEIFIALADQKERMADSDLGMLLLNISTIMSDYPDEYFEEISVSIPPNTQEEKVQLFEDKFKPFLFSLLESQDALLHDYLTTAFVKITQTRTLEEMAKSDSHKRFDSILSGKSRSDRIKELLFDTINSAKSNNAIISAMKIIARLPVSIEDVRVMKLISKHLSNKDPLVAAQAIRTLNFFGTKFEKFEPKARNKVYTLFKKLIRSNFYHLYKIDSSIEVKEAIIEGLELLAPRQPNVPMLFKAIQRMGMDPVPPIAIRAVNLYFEYMETKPTYKKDFLDYLRYFANSPVPEVSQILIEKIILLYKQGVKLSKVLPTLTKLATSPNDSIRKRSLNVLSDMYKDNPEDFLFFMDIILLLTRSRNPEFRKNAVTILFGVLFENPENIKDNRILFDAIRKLSRDKDHEVKLIISSYLEKMVEVFPNKLNDFLGIIYNFIRESKSDLMQNTIFAIKSLYESNEKSRDDIMVNLKRFYKKSQDGMLLTLINDLEGK